MPDTPAISSSAPAAFDPYEPRPTFVQRNGQALAAVAVFILTALLTVVSFPPFQTPEFAYAMLVPGSLWAYTRPRFKLFAITLLAAQAVAWTILLWWLHNVTWAGLFLLGPFIGVWVGSWFLAAWWALPRMLGKPTINRLVAMLGLASVWVIIEWTRTWVLGGFPWLPLAASQWKTVAMLQVAAFTGSGGVSFVIVAVNIGFTAYAHRLFREGVTGLNKRSQEFFLALFLVLACLSIHVQEAFNRAYYQTTLGRVAFVQPYIPQSVKWDESKGPDIRDVLERTTLAAGASKPDLILWPESATPWAVRGHPEMKAFVESLALRAQAPLVLGSNAIEGTTEADMKWYNAAFLVTPDKGVQADYYMKRQLVPFGEFVPFRPVLGWLGKFVPIGPDDFSRGTEPAPLIVSLRKETIIMAPLICYEDIFPSLARSSTQSGANVLTVLTNNGWFGEGGAAYQHAAHSVLRAVENRRPVLRAGNGGWSGWIDEFGSVRAHLTNDKGSIYFRGTQTIEVKRDTRWIDRASFYSRYGEWFLLVCAALVMLAFALLKLETAVQPQPTDEAKS